MNAIHPKYLVDENNRRHAVVLSIEEWNHILEELEELDDIRAFDAAVARNEVTIPLEQAIREIENQELASYRVEKRSIGRTLLNSKE